MSKPKSFTDEDGNKYMQLHAAKDGSVVYIQPEEDGKPKRWRAQEGEQYFCVGRDINIFCDREAGYPLDDSRYEAGNYFVTMEQAEAVAEAMKALLNYIQPYGEPDWNPMLKRIEAARKLVHEGGDES